MDFDIVIAGGGLAGSAMLRQLSLQPSLQKKRILVVDRSLEIRNDRTWCYWTPADEFTDSMVEKEWPTVELAFPEGIDRYPLRGLTYRCIRSGPYLEACRGLADDLPNVSYLEAAVEGFEHDGASAVTKTTQGDIRSSIVFQSCLRPQPERRRRKPIRLLQHFLGWEIETDEDVFDTNCARIMDFRTPQDQGFAFMYVLPFSKRRALVEHTLFSGHVSERGLYEHHLQAYLAQGLNLPGGSYRLLRSEYGVIPMEDEVYPAWWCKGVLNLGQAGGQSKASTGYTFSRTLRYAEDLALAMVTGDWRHLRPGSKWRFRNYDRLILWMLREKPDQVVEVFRELFRKNDTDRLMRFLDEQTNFAEEFNIFTTTKWRWFFEAIAKAR